MNAASPHPPADTIVIMPKELKAKSTKTTKTKTFKRPKTIEPSQSLESLDSLDSFESLPSSQFDENGEHIKRPANCFILYRQHLQDQANWQGTAQSKISKHAGGDWANLSREEKDYWRAQAAEEKRLHKLKYPNYRFQPKRPRKLERKGSEMSEMSNQDDRGSPTPSSSGSIALHEYYSPSPSLVSTRVSDPTFRVVLRSYPSPSQDIVPIPIENAYAEYSHGTPDAGPSHVFGSDFWHEFPSTTYPILSSSSPSSSPSFPFVLHPESHMTSAASQTPSEHSPPPPYETWNVSLQGRTFSYGVNNSNDANFHSQSYPACVDPSVLYNGQQDIRCLTQAPEPGVPSSSSHGAPQLIPAGFDSPPSQDNSPCSYPQESSPHADSAGGTVATIVPGSSAPPPYVSVFTADEVTLLDELCKEAAALLATTRDAKQSPLAHGSRSDYTDDLLKRLVELLSRMFNFSST